MSTTPPSSRSVRLWALGLGLACFLGAALAAGQGFMSIPAGAVLKVLATKLGLSVDLSSLEPAWTQVVWEVRLPRVLSALAVGGGLGLAGVVYQGVLLNPLADPYTLGVSAGAAFGASVSLLLGLNILGPATLPALAFAGALAALAVVVWLAWDTGGVSTASLVLAGVIVAAILGAAIGLVKHLADEQVAGIIFWIMGSLVGRTWGQTGLVWGALGLGLAVCSYYARDLNILSLGGRQAGALGVEPKRTRLVLLVTVSLVAAVAVSVSGIIGFVGLVVPHLMRLLVGPDHRGLIWLSALGGGLLLLAADTLTRAWLPSEVPIGVLTALIGGPYFCYLFRRRRRGGLGW